MSRMMLWLANAALLVLACAVTVWVLRQAPLPDSAAGRAEAKPPRSDRKSERRAGPKETAGATAPRDAVSGADADVLWQQTLFRPERTEDLTEAAPEDAAAASLALNLELVGLARIGERAVAVIVQHRGQTVRRLMPVGAGGPAGLSRTTVPRLPAPTGPAADATAPAEGPPDRHVYKVGDKVGDSGYSLKEIRFAEKEVVLVRGSEERTLKLETDDDQSASRRETAAVLPPPPKPAPETAAATKPPGGTGTPTPVVPAGVPQPPPPPVAGAVPVPATGMPPGATTGSTTHEVRGAVPTLSREERLERARMLRERILQGRPPSGTSN